jgi:hypothetical protein
MCNKLTTTFFRVCRRFFLVIGGYFALFTICATLGVFMGVGFGGFAGALTGAASASAPAPWSPS